MVTISGEILIKIIDRSNNEYFIYPKQLSAKLSANAATEMTLIFDNPDGINTNIAHFKDNVEIDHSSDSTKRKLIFDGTVLKVSSGSSVNIKCYDVLEKLNKEHIPPNEGLYVATDAGAIIKDIINNSGHDIESGVDISTGYIVDSIDLTDKSRLDSIKLLINMINGKEDKKTYHIYVSNGKIIFNQLPDYVNDEPAITLTDSDIINISVHEDGNAYFNCCTVVGDGVRGYYPYTTNPNGGHEPNFPDEPRHKLITSNSLKGTADCLNLARGFVIAHRDLSKKISLSFVPNRFDFFPGLLIELNAPKYNAFGKYRLRDISWTYSLNKKMNFTLSAIETTKLTTYIN